MGPISLFDKSFLQSLSLDESVWFSHFFMPVVCPLFYVETLADLEKAVREGRTPEREVGIIADKFPDLGGVPTVHHATLALHELLGHTVVMDGRPHRPGGKVVVRNGKRGMIYDESPEALAFSRWQHGDFLEVERRMAKGWRADLQSIDLKGMAASLRELGIDASTCRSLEQAHMLASAAVDSREKPFATIALVMHLLNVPRQFQQAIFERWKNNSYRSIRQHAPYVAHLLTVELFFQFALAAHLIGTERASNKVDIAYLNYLPFCMMFVSSDELHRRCAPLFLRRNQKFVWGPDLKLGLTQTNKHFAALPDSTKERGIMAFANAPPEGSIVRDLRSHFLRPGYDDREPSPPQESGAGRKVLSDLKEWKSAPRTSDESIPTEEELEMMTIERQVRRKKGSWWQVPKDLPDPKPET